MPELIINLVHSWHGQPHQQNISAPYRSSLALTMALVSAWAQLHNSRRVPLGAPMALRGQIRALPYFWMNCPQLAQSEFPFSCSVNWGQTTSARYSGSSLCGTLRGGEL